MPSHLPPSRRRDETRAPSLRWASPTPLPRYYGLLGLPLGTNPLRHRLIGSAFARRGPPRRASPVPCWTVPACRPPYPERVLCTAAFPCTVCCLRPDMTGSAPLPFGAYLTRLQGSRFRIRPAGLPPPEEPYGSRRAFDAPLRRPESLPPPGAGYAAQRLAYRDGTCTRESSTAFRTHHTRKSNSSRAGGLPVRQPLLDRFDQRAPPPGHLAGEVRHRLVGGVQGAPLGRVGDHVAVACRVAEVGHDSAQLGVVRGLVPWVAAGLDGEVVEQPADLAEGLSILGIVEVLEGSFPNESDSFQGGRVD